MTSVWTQVTIFSSYDKITLWAHQKFASECSLYTNVGRSYKEFCPPGSATNILKKLHSNWPQLCYISIKLQIESNYCLVRFSLYYGNQIKKKTIWKHNKILFTWAVRHLQDATQYNFLKQSTASLNSEFSLS